MVGARGGPLGKRVTTPDKRVIQRELLNHVMLLHRDRRVGLEVEGRLRRGGLVVPGQVWAAGFEGRGRCGIPIKASNPLLLQLGGQADGSVDWLVGRIVRFVPLDGDKVEQGAFWGLPFLALFLLVLLVLCVRGHPLSPLFLPLRSLEPGSVAAA